MDTKARPTWQQMLGTLATRGYVVFTYDPIGQGERLQLYDVDWGQSKVFRNNTEHTILGIQCLLVGDNLARYTIWDGLRALDYLTSRPEVDSRRIACTGNSGGGNLTAYLAALDDRIQVAAPSCWITSWQRLVETIGQQDAEQVLLPWLRDGLDYADFIHAFAPKPYLVLSAIRDFFSITGTRETYEEVRQVYARLGAEEKLAKAEADAGHDYSKPLRMAAYRWFDRWLKGQSSADDIAEVNVTFATGEELRCTDTGQVLTSLGGETVFSLNRKRLEEVGRKPITLETKNKFQSFQEQTWRDVRRLVNWDEWTEPLRKNPPRVRRYGEILRSGYRIEKLTYESEPGILIPALLLVPQSSSGRARAVVYVDGHGKSAEAEAGQELEQLVQAGFVVLAIDARGFGETEVLETQQADDVRPFFGDYDSGMTALLVGRPLVAMRAFDISRAVDLLQSLEGVDSQQIHGMGRGNGAVALLYAATLDTRIKMVVLEQMLQSYRAVVDNRVQRQVFESAVPRVLRFYDLPDLVAALAPRPVWIVSPVDAVGQVLPVQRALGPYDVARGAFKLLGQETLFRLRTRQPGTLSKTYPELFEKR
jgi:cephalosporin-C deacetylase-like acetyl esterase